MALTFQKNENLAPGIHLISWEEFEKSFGYNIHRRNLIEGLKLGMKHLRECGCTKLYVDGSFVSKKEYPNDFDACWDITGVDLQKIKDHYRALWTFTDGRAAQKQIYKGEFFPAAAQAQTRPPRIYIDFFQYDRDDNSKGLIELQLN